MQDSTASTSRPAASSEPVNEYEREPVPEKARLGFKSFIGQYAGEHCAGTELMIGPLFVAAGVSAAGVIGGLLVGNFLAVLCWRFLTAPIATQARLTLYYQLEKICGRNLVVLYNLANGLMFCFLAGAMITVSATAAGVMFDFPMPTFGEWMPNSVPWVVSVLVVGVLISIVAAFGYSMVSRFANIAAPWMVLVFLAFGLIALKQFMVSSGTEVHGAGDLVTLANDAIWRGGDPLPGQIKFTFWHVMFFAWFCNMAMHIGMSDLSVMRFAKRSSAGWAPASGMYVGHMMAWLAASMLFALQLYQTHPNAYTADLLVNHADTPYAAGDLADMPLTPELIGNAMQAEAAIKEDGKLEDYQAAFIESQVAAGVARDDVQTRVSNPSPLPGPLANNAAGIAGLLCVIIAGWTTANPTIYRAGLAFQAVMPGVSRFKVTIATGMFATIAGLFPALAFKLLDFVALYGLILMPMGAVIVIDWYVLKRLGLRPNFAEAARKSFNAAAAAAWVLTVATCLVLIYGFGLQAYLFFISLPGWFLAAGLYVVISKVIQKQPAGVTAAA